MPLYLPALSARHRNFRGYMHTFRHSLRKLILSAILPLVSVRKNHILPGLHFIWWS